MTQSTNDYAKRCKAIARRFNRTSVTGKNSRDDPHIAEGVRLSAWSDLADVVVEGIADGDMRRVDVMDRPATLPIDDHKMYARVSKLRNQKRNLSTTDVDWLREFNGWMDDVRTSEGRNLGNVTCILTIIAKLDESVTGDERASALREFMQREYEWAGADPFELNAASYEAHRCTRMEEVLPSWLMLGRAPDDGTFVPSNYGDDETKDDDDDSPAWMRDDSGDRY